MCALVMLRSAQVVKAVSMPVSIHNIQITFITPVVWPWYGLSCNTISISALTLRGEGAAYAHFHFTAVVGKVSSVL